MALRCHLTISEYGPVVDIDSEESDLASFDRSKAAEVKRYFFSCANTTYRNLVQDISKITGKIWTCCPLQKTKKTGALSSF